LYLNEGTWNGARIVSADWVRESTRERLRFGFGGFKEWGYGYNWMQTGYRARGRVLHSYFHSGDGGQLLSVLPELNMVIVFTAGNYGTNPNRTYDRIMEKYILPAVSSVPFSRE
jgi:CubicO group peptidase (beta-lactamase class C family)